MGLHFSQEEFRLRKSKVIDSMKEQNIDALLMFRQESMYWLTGCLLYTSPSPRDAHESRMPSSA